MRALLGLVVVGACGSAAPPACPRPSPPARAELLLWQATRADQPTIYLFGTVHHAGRDDIPPTLWEVIGKASHLYTETGSLEPDADEMRDLVRMPPGEPPLQQQMSDDDWYELRDALRGTIEEDELARMPPWYAMARLRATVAPPPTPTMDAAIVEEMLDHGRAVNALETPEAQLAELAKAVTVPDVLATLHERGTLACRLHELLAVYQTGDLPELERRLVTPGVASLLGPRNAKWVKVLIQPRGRGAVFAAVGIGHLLGPESLLVMLERAGYFVARWAPR